MRVAVVGAGIAGLRTAQLLERSGVHATVFDARDRVGGRMWTDTVGGAEFEAGAEWIDAEHARVFALLAELSLSAVASDPRPGRCFFGGQFIEPPKIVYRMDARGETLADLLDASASSPLQRAYLEAVALSEEGTDSDRVGLAEWKRFACNYEGRVGGEMSAFRFPLRASELCARIAESLRGAVCLNTELTHVAGGSLRFADGQREEFDEVVLTLPPPCLDELEYDGPAAWRGVQMTPTFKVALLFDGPFWEDEGWSGQMMSDLPVQQVWADGSALVCYINGRGAEKLVEQGDPATFALKALAKAVPGVEEHFQCSTCVEWSYERFSRGGFPFVPPGAKRLAPPAHGPVRFAGDWTADWMGFVEGALESAERVVKEFKDEHGLS